MKKVNEEVDNQKVVKLVISKESKELYYFEKVNEVTKQNNECMQLRNKSRRKQIFWNWNYNADVNKTKRLEKCIVWLYVLL